MNIKINKNLRNLLEPELDIMKHVAQGKTNKQIAKEIYVSEHTVKAHIAKVLHVMNVKDRTEAVYKLAKFGLI